MAEVALMNMPSTVDHPVQPPMRSDMFPNYQSSALGHMVPNPDFSFPARSLPANRPTSANMSTSAVRSRTGALGQRRSASALPNFTFNPAAPPSSSPASSNPSTPPQSPALSVPATPARHMGHRRGGSELIGDVHQASSSGSMSLSPTKGDGTLAPPTFSSLGPPPGRRGHSHRRSGAISCHDLQSILHPIDANAHPRGSSAPVTPFDTGNKTFFEPHARRTVSDASLTPTVGSPIQDLMTHSLHPSPQIVLPRQRVGFSERIEYIRPLSTISSETESSMSTIRGHSVNGSLSSVLSTGAASPPSVRLGRPSLQTTFEDGFPGARPRTASDVFDSASSAKEALSASLTFPQRPRSSAASEWPTETPPVVSSPVKSKVAPRRRALGWFDQRRSCKMHSVVVRESRSESSLVAFSPHSPPFLVPALSDDEALDEHGRSIKADSSRKPRKVKSWAHSLIASRHKPKTAVEDTVASVAQDASPESEAVPQQSYLGLVADFDADNTVDIFTLTAPTQPSPFRGTLASTTPRSETSRGSESPLPMIDLDAALGPFNTPHLGPRSPHARPSGSRRALHSGGFGSGSSALGQHRRTESAPELAPFEGRMGKLNANSAMADVFEEDEEEYESPKDKRRLSAAFRKSLSKSTEPSLVDAKVTISSGIIDTGLGISTADSQAVPLSLQHVSATLASHRPSATAERYSRESSPVEVVEDYEEPRDSSYTKDSDSTVTPTVSEGESKQPAALTNLQLSHVAPPIMTPDTFSSSPLSTPDYSRGSRPSYDGSRIGTAASSINDNRTVHSYLVGEPGAEFARPSVDDVPSLTSSRSTVTSPPQHAFAHPFGQPDPRSASMFSIPSSGATEHTKKRGSIASLSRLVGGSFGQRSKLSIETRPQPDNRSRAGGEERAGKKRGKRMSRLMNFWKAKEHHQS